MVNIILNSGLIFLFFILPFDVYCQTERLDYVENLINSLKSTSNSIDCKSIQVDIESLYYDHKLSLKRETIEIYMLDFEREYIQSSFPPIRDGERNYCNDSHRTIKALNESIDYINYNDFERFEMLLDAIDKSIEKKENFTGKSHLLFILIGELGLEFLEQSYLKLTETKKEIFISTAIKLNDFDKSLQLLRFALSNEKYEDKQKRIKYQIEVIVPTRKSLFEKDQLHESKTPQSRAD